MNRHLKSELKHLAEGLTHGEVPKLELESFTSALESIIERERVTAVEINIQHRERTAWHTLPKDYIDWIGRRSS